MRPHHWKVLGDLLLQVRVVRLFQKVREMMKKFLRSVRMHLARYMLKQRIK